jgi:hypothetical protein
MSKCTVVAPAIALELLVLSEIDRITAVIVDTWMVDVTLKALYLAVICVLPAWTALTRPAALTLAVPGVDDDHCAEAVRSAVEPSDRLSIAEHCVVWPIEVSTCAAQETTNPVLVGLVGPPQPDNPAIGVRNSRQTTAERQKGIAGDIGALLGKRTMMRRPGAAVKRGTNAGVRCQSRYATTGRDRMMHFHHGRTP